MTGNTQKRVFAWASPGAVGDGSGEGVGAGEGEGDGEGPRPPATAAPPDDNDDDMAQKEQRDGAESGAAERPLFPCCADLLRAQSGAKRAAECAVRCAADVCARPQIESANRVADLLCGGRSHNGAAGGTVVEADANSQAIFVSTHFHPRRSSRPARREHTEEEEGVIQTSGQEMVDRKERRGQKRRDKRATCGQGRGWGLAASAAWLERTRVAQTTLAVRGCSL